MIEPGDRFEIEHNGRTISVPCMTRSRQRKIVGVLAQLQNLEESVESIEKVYDLADEMLELCLPNLPDSEREMMSNQDAFEIASKVLAAHTIGGETKKKSELLRSSVRANSARGAVVPDVFISSMGS